MIRLSNILIRKTCSIRLPSSNLVIQFSFEFTLINKKTSQFLERFIIILIMILSCNVHGSGFPDNGYFYLSRISKLVLDLFRNIVG